MVTALGLDCDSTWRAVKAGRCGMQQPRAIESPTPQLCEVGQAPDVSADWHPNDEREVRYLKKALVEALDDAGLNRDAWPYASPRCGMILGTTLAGMRSGGRFLRTNDPAHLQHFLAGHTLAAVLDGLPLTGLSTTTCAACASGLSSIGLALTLLRERSLDLVIAGGYDTLSEYALGGFGSLRLLAEGAISPFSITRSGMKLGEGYGLLVLERLRDSQERGATVCGIIAGFGESSDAHHLTQPEPAGDGAARAIRAALASADFRRERIELIAAHGTATPNSDAAEFHALQAVLRDDLPRIPLIAFKSHLGHTLGGAGAVELILTLRAMRDGCIPPVANAQRAKIEFPELNISVAAEERAVDTTLNLSLGFGGANCAVILHRIDSSMSKQLGREESFSHDDTAVCITGIGALGPGFTGITELVEALRMRKDHPLQSGTVDESPLDCLIDARRTRRMSSYVKYLLAAATLAIRDADIEDLPSFIGSAAAIVGTAHGSSQYSADYYRAIVERGLDAANPMLFAEGVPNAGAAHLSLMLGLKGPSQTIIGTRTAGLDALILAAARIRSGEWQRAFVGAAEEFSPIVNRAYAEIGSRQKPGSTSGSGSEHGISNAAGGAAVLILESMRSASQRSARIYATISGVAAARATCRSAAGMVRAARTILASIDIAQQSVLLGATGSRLDRIERLSCGAGTSRSRQSQSAPTFRSVRFPEMFSVTPLLAAAAGMLMESVHGASERTAPFITLASDWCGDVRAVSFAPAVKGSCEFTTRSILCPAESRGWQP